MIIVTKVSFTLSDHVPICTVYLSKLDLDSASKDLKFTLTGDGSISFQNLSTGDCGYLHSMGSYVLMKSGGSVIMDAPTANMKVSGMNIQANVRQDVVVEAKGQVSLSLGRLRTRHGGARGLDSTPCAWYSNRG